MKRVTLIPLSQRRQRSPRWPDRYRLLVHHPVSESRILEQRLQRLLDHSLSLNARRLLPRQAFCRPKHLNPRLPGELQQRGLKRLRSDIEFDGLGQLGRARGLNQPNSSEESASEQSNEPIIVL